MLSQVQVLTGGDTALILGEVLERTDFQAVAHGLSGLAKIALPGDSSFEPSTLVPREELKQECTRLEAQGRRAPTWEELKPPTAAPVLRGITQLGRCQSPLCAGGLTPMPTPLMK